MGRLIKIALCLGFAVLVSGGSVFGQQEATSRERVLTHADAAVLLARYSGLFDRYIDSDANMTECVGFLNKHGIYFGLLEVVNGTEFSLKDCARTMGQIDLVFSGEAEFIHGKVKLPKDVESWEEFCILNDVKFKKTHQSMRKLMGAVALQFSE